MKELEKKKAVLTTKGLVSLVSCVILVAILIYFSFMIFRPDRWGNFSEYFGLIANTVIATAIFFLSEAVYQNQKERDKWEKKILEMQEKPILRFFSSGGKTYRLYNMGKAAAHKIIVGRVSSVTENFEKPTYKVYSLPYGAYLELPWTQNSSVLFAYYEGAESTDIYVIKCQGDENDDQFGDLKHVLAHFLLSFKDRTDRVSIHFT